MKLEFPRVLDSTRQKRLKDSNWWTTWRLKSSWLPWNLNLWDADVYRLTKRPFFVLFVSIKKRNFYKMTI